MFENFLAQLNGAVPGFAGGMIQPTGVQQMMGGMPGTDAMQGIEQALAHNQELARFQRPQQRKPGLMDVLGILGDSILAGKGRQPIYGPMMQQRREQERRQQMGEYIANYLGDSDGALSEIMRADPETGLALYKMTHAQEKEKPAFYRELEAAGFNPQQIQQIMKQRYTRPIIVGSAATGYGVLDEEGGDSDAGGEVPTVNSQAEYDALPAGTQYRDSQGNVGVKRGGPTASPSGVFPGQ